MSYIIEHSGAKLILVDSEYVHLIDGTTVPTVISNDTGREDDPYEEFLGKPHGVPGFGVCYIYELFLPCSASGRRFSGERGWNGLEMEVNEDANASLCYT